MSAVCELVPLKRLARQASISSSPIKNTVSQEYEPGLLPGYSASGQDVWLTPEQATFRGSGIVVSAVGARCGKSFLADGQWGVTANTSVVIPLAGTSARYLWYLLNDEEFWIKGQTAQPYVQMGPSLMQLVPKLTTERQEAVADFLDRETAKIDALIAKQEQLIATLREERTATITHAVTKGLDPDVAMKESGIAWLGAQPAAWKREKLAWLFTFHNGDRGVNYPSAADMLADGVPFINAGHLVDGSVAFDSMNYISEEKYAAMGGAKLKPGDILYCLRGSLGKNALLEALPAGGALASSLVALRVIDRSRLHPRFGYLLLNSAPEAAQRHVISSGSAQPNMAVDDLARFRFGVPPIAEQQQIVDFVDAQCRKIDDLIAKSLGVIATLREYRSALITNAVTGKIDVRGAA